MKAGELHRLAMSHLDDSEVFRFKKDESGRMSSLKEAYKHEREAALMDSPEPTKSVLLYSAACLAWRIGEEDAARELYGKIATKYDYMEDFDNKGELK